MCVPSLNEIRDIIFELSRTQVGGGTMEVKPVYPQVSSGDITKHRYYDNVIFFLSE